MVYGVKIRKICVFETNFRILQPEALHNIGTKVHNYNYDIT